MNAVDATPQLSFGDRATLASRRYPLVNLPIRTTTIGRKKLRQCYLWLTDAYRRGLSPFRGDGARLIRANASGEML
jgi:hypothetical protein